MRAASWDACSEPDRMLSAAGGRLSDRKLLLFACACARRVWDVLPEFARPAVPLVERAAEIADPEARDEALREALTDIAGNVLGWALVLLQPRLQPLDLARRAASFLRFYELRFPDRPAAPPGPHGGLALLIPFLNVDEYRASAAQAELLRCVAGNPFRRSRFRPDWRTSDAVALAAGIYADGAFDRLPILADALQDAGCDNEAALAHCREPGVHARGCWVVDRVVGKS